MRIGIVSLYTQEIEDLVVHTSSNQSRYSEINGYDYILFKGRFSNRFPAWDKIKAVEEVLPNYDYVLWIDSDCVFKKLNYRLETLLNHQCKGYFGKDPVNTIYVNTGVFLLKNDPWSFDLLKYSWGKTGKQYTNVDKYSYQDWPFEQGPICEYLQNDTGNHCIVPEYMLNCHPSFDSDKTFILHYMGCRTNEKTYKDTLSRIMTLNSNNGIIPKPPTYVDVSKNELGNQTILYKRDIKVTYETITGDLSFVVKKNNTLCFDYRLPNNQRLSHIFKVNNNNINFNSDPFGCFEVPDDFELYHSYEWYGRTDFKYIGHFKIND